MRHQIFTPCLLLVVVVAGCGGGGTEQARPAVKPKTQRACVPGVFHRLGSAKLAYAAVVRSRAVVSRRPAGRPFAASAA